jgi:hypothetical protein
MENRRSRLLDLHTVCCASEDGTSEYRMPRPEFFSNIPLLWTILTQIVDDWNREAASHQETIDASTSQSEAMLNSLTAFDALQPRFLHCLFSYVMFFVA